MNQTAMFLDEERQVVKILGYVSMLVPTLFLAVNVRSVGQVAFASVGMGLFFLSYTASLRLRRDDARVVVQGVQLLVSLAFGWVFSIGFLLMCVYPTISAARMSSLRRVLIALVVVLSAMNVEILVKLRGSVGAIMVLILTLTLVTIAYAIRSFLRVLKMTQELQLAQDTIRTLTALAERERIGRDLHDTLHRTLSAIAVKGQLAERYLQMERIDELRDEIRDIVGLASESIVKNREIVHDLLEHNLQDELQESAEYLLEANIETSIHARGIERIPCKVSRELSMCLRELVTNVVRHSQARHCRIFVEVVSDRVQLQVQDDGIGIGQARHFSGLTGLKKRVARLGGDVRINEDVSLRNTSCESGTNVVVRVPLQ